MRPILADRPVARLDAVWQGPLKHYVRALLSTCLGLTLMLSCYRAPITSQASANDLSVFVAFYDDTPSPSMVTISVGFSKGGQVIALGGNLSMACNGTVFPPVSFGTSASNITLPRQPDGSTYHCVYTDEHGTKTPLTIPTPQGKGQITSPAPGATLQITEPQYTSVNTSRPAGQVTTVTIRYTLPTPPACASAQASAVAVCGPPDCVAVRGDETIADGTYVLTDAHLPYGEGFETFPSRWHNEIRLSFRFDWFPPAGGFQAVRMIYTDTLITTVTWSRG